MNQRHFRGEIGQEQGFFDSGIAPANHHDLLAAIEEPVTGGTGRHAEALERFFAVQAQPFGPRSGRQNHCVRCICGATVAGGLVWPFGHVQIGDDVADDLATHRLSVGLHPHHQVRPLNLCVAGPILDLGGGGQLPARFQSLYQNRIQHGTAGIDSGGIARRAGADDQNLGVT